MYQVVIYRHILVTGNMRVLCLPCGSGIGQEVYHSLGHRRDIELFGLDSSDDTPGKALYGSMFYSGAPRLSSQRAELVQFLKFFITLNEIEYVFPGTDDFVNFLKENEDNFGGVVVTSCLETCIISRSKKLTYQTLRDVIRVPEMFREGEVDGFPVFLKPERGAGAIGCRKINDVEDLEHSYERGRDLICEYLPGDEYTVDALTGPCGRLLYHCPRARTMTRAGISIVTSEVTDTGVLEEVRDMAARINDHIEFTGAWFFQVKRASDGSLCLLEIAPRIAGAMAFSRMSGVNLPLLSLNISAGLPVRVDGYVNPVCTMKAYKTYMSPPLEFKNLYVDLDDTIVIKNRVHPEAMKCLYKYSAKGVSIHMITRHPGNLVGYLRRFHIPESLFTSIQQIHDMSKKSSCIAPDSVFIDDSFKERSEVSSSGKNVRVYDVDAFEFL